MAVSSPLNLEWVESKCRQNGQLFLQLTCHNLQEQTVLNVLLGFLLFDCDWLSCQKQHIKGGLSH